MPYEFKAVRRVEFAETDMAGIMHFSNFFRFMETAEHGFIRSLGYSVVMANENPPMGWPRVHVACDFMQPLRFEDEVEIHLLVCEKRPRVLSYQFRFYKLGGEKKVEVARGKITAVCVQKLPNGILESVPMPAALDAQIQVAPAELLAPGPAQR